MLTSIRRRIAREEHGFAMVAVMAALAVSGLLVMAAVTAANGDLPIARKSQDRKQAYAAAEAGLNYYLFHLNVDPDYWLKCTAVADPNPADPTDNSPVNLQGANPRVWRNVTGTTSKYTIELVPAPGKASCLLNNESSMLDPNTGMFRIRVTGRSGSVTRTIVASFRRKGFLDYLWVTNFETGDPDNDTSGTTTVAACGKPRSLRNAACSGIVFAGGDNMKGPVHTNDESILTCASPTFGRTGQSEKDKVEVVGTGSPGWINNSNTSCAAGTPTFNTATTKLGLGAAPVSFPATNAALEATATTGGKVFTGKTTIELLGTGSPEQMKVTNAYLTPATQTMDVPGNGVIFVKSKACTLTSIPADATYNEGADCAVVYVKGKYNTSLTIASQGDIIIQPTDGVNDTGIVRVADSPAVVGLIADRFIRVEHKVKQNTSGAWINADATEDVQIDAAMLSVQHSFLADNYDVGAHMGDLVIHGAIGQNFRGPVGQTNITNTGPGYTKDYNYDNRLKYRSPPYFLPPVNAAWSVANKHEQVPAVSGP